MLALGSDGGTWVDLVSKPIMEQTILWYTPGQTADLSSGVTFTRLLSPSCLGRGLSTAFMRYCSYMPSMQSSAGLLTVSHLRHAAANRKPASIA